MLSAEESAHDEEDEERGARGVCLHDGKAGPRVAAAYHDDDGVTKSTRRQPRTRRRCASAHTPDDGDGHEAEVEARSSLGLPEEAAYAREGEDAVTARLPRKSRGRVADSGVSAVIESRPLPRRGARSHQQHRALDEGGASR